MEDLGYAKPSAFTGYARKRALDDSDIPEEDEDVQTTIIRLIVSESSDQEE